MYFFIVSFLFTLISQQIYALDLYITNISEEFIGMNGRTKLVAYKAKNHPQVLKTLEAFVSFRQAMSPALRPQLYSKIHEIVDGQALKVLSGIHLSNVTDFKSLPKRLKDKGILSDLESRSLEMIIQKMHGCARKLDFHDDNEHRTLYYLSYQEFKDYMAKVAFQKYSELNPEDNLMSDYYLSKDQLSSLEYLGFVRWYKANFMRLDFIKFLIKKYDLGSSLSILLEEENLVPKVKLNSDL